MTAPLCGCHGEPMRWAKDSRPRYKTGGYWRCAVKLRNTQSAYDKTDAGRERHRRYNQTPAGRDRDRRYCESPLGFLNRQLLEISRVRVRY